MQELREAILVLNRDAAFEAIARIADQAPEAAAGVRVVVKNLQMDKLHDVISSSISQVNQAAGNSELSPPFDFKR